MIRSCPDFDASSYRCYSRDAVELRRSLEKPGTPNLKRQNKNCSMETSQEEGLAPAVGKRGQAVLPDLFYSLSQIHSPVAKPLLKFSLVHSPSSTTWLFFVRLGGYKQAQTSQKPAKLRFFEAFTPSGHVGESPDFPNRFPLLDSVQPFR